MVTWVAGCCLVVAALAVVVPVRGRTLRRLLSALDHGSDAALSPARPRRHPHPPLWTVLLAGAATLVVGSAIAGGPVAGLATAAYCGVAARILRRRRADRLASRSRERALDAMYSLAADLRAGAPASMASTADGGGRLAWLVEALRRVADQTGAPLADLLERAAADARATDRIRAVAAAQAAGAQATAWLLAALPAGGIALGYTIGADPLRVLLHTPIGAGCAAGGIVLQVAGLVWADRLIRPTALDTGVRR
jgi:tight adherence protein B